MDNLATAVSMVLPKVAWTDHAGRHGRH